MPLHHFSIKKLSFSDMAPINILRVILDFAQSAWPYLRYQAHFSTAAVIIVWPCKHEYFDCFSINRASTWSCICKRQKNKNRCFKMSWLMTCFVSSHTPTRRHRRRTFSGHYHKDHRSCKHIMSHTLVYVCIYMYISVCVCVCVCTLVTQHEWGNTCTSAHLTTCMHIQTDEGGC